MPVANPRLSKAVWRRDSGVRAAVERVSGVTPGINCTGGTSDGRFVAELCPEVVEFGPVNASIHKLNEHVDLAAIEPLRKIYLGLLGRLLAS